MRVSRALLVWMVAWAGCDDPDLTVGDIYADLSVSLCVRIGQCCTERQISCTSGRALDEDGCQELVRLALREAFYVTDDAVDQGKRRIDQEAAEACLAQTDELSCHPGPPPAPWGSLPEPCREMFPGSTGIGEECFRNDECAPGLRCSVDGFRGVCTPLQMEEDPCFIHEHCTDDLYCSADGYVCRPRAIEGAGCEEDPGVAEAPLCQRGLWCDPDSERCVGPGDLDEDCTFDNPCRVGLVCDLVESTCIEPRENDEDCFSPLECESGFCSFDQGVCDDDENRCIVGLGLIGVEECTE